MFSNYTPNHNSVLDPPWTFVQLSQRDVSLQIPINYLTHPGISISTACFGHKVYAEDAAEQCISNLIAAGYRRLVADLYWSAERRRWTFCPVNIPVQSAHTKTSRSEIPPSDDIPSPGLSGTHIVERADNNSDDGGPALQQLGPYSCEESLDLSTLVGILLDYFQETEDTLSAHLVYLLFNLHATKTSGSDDHPQAVTGTNLPGPNDLIGHHFSQTVRNFMYTPPELDDERSNLNKSWFSVAREDRPIAEYFTMKGSPGQIKTTPDGWPCEKYVEIIRGKRLLLGWGAADPQMSSYNFSGDDNIVFKEGALAHSITFDTPFTSGGDGTEESGCLFNPNTTNVFDINGSWAVSDLYIDNSTLELAAVSDEMAGCGISPLINATLYNVTADVDVNPYLNFSLSTAWSWADGEPHNSSNPGGSGSGTPFRCALMDLSQVGHWRAADCSSEFYAACRVRNNPYQWTLSSERVSYPSAPESCPDNSSFSVPRTGLENTYLFIHLLTQPNDTLDASSDDESRRNVWIDFNSLDVPTCWVTHGPDAQCPYEAEGGFRRRTVLVPIIAAIIVLIITALTLFVKCNANRRNSRRTRVIEGWEYEGVPS
ncbi:hypothetical protein AJ80_02452 [Polytolypa hystricis UAMH7299]|uniref:Maintenance of telomere capping protein 6 n=1 Tax=Polytolypa hystricis (strain UAMH7299) TaxID=1447883 RepID=A0A2B7YRJ3_POLH7|nr:hypothetical protein AJ80_02452 [Polytolypa hystricis UAMH7299]